MPGNRAGKSATSSGVEPGAAGGVGRGHRARHDVTRRQLGARVRVEREASPLAVHEDGARAAHRLGDERRGVHAGQLERGRMELEELEVAQPGAGPMGEGPAVGGRDLGIRRHGVQLAHAAGGQHHRGGEDRCAGAAVRAAP